MNISLRDLGATAFIGSVACALFNRTMFVGRLAHESFVAWFNARTSLLTSGTPVIVAGRLLLVPDCVPAAVTAFALTYLGIVSVMPTALSEATQHAPSGSGAVTYLSFGVCALLIARFRRRCQRLRSAAWDCWASAQHCPVTGDAQKWFLVYNEAMMTYYLRFIIMLLVVALAGCGSLPVTLGSIPTATPAPQPTSTSQPTVAPTDTPRPTFTATPTSTPTATPTVTPYPLLPTPTLARLSANERQTIFEDVWTLVRDRYVYEDYGGVDWDAVRTEFEPHTSRATSEAEFYALIEEMVGRLGDDHTRFDTPQEVAEEAARFDGGVAYAGIGALIRDLEEGILITRLAPGGPAEQAGLQPRDLIIAVNGVPVSDTVTFGPGGPVSVVRGQPGTPVQLRIIDNTGATRDVTVIRQVIPPDAFPIVEARRVPGTDIGVVLIDTFNVSALDERVTDAIKSLYQSGPLDGLILDVRTNSGGRLDMLRRTLGLFLDGGTIGSSSGRDRSFSIDVPSGKTLSLLEQTPLVVLTSDETASAAEMFAAGLQFRGRARVVGTPSAGNTENLIGHDLDDGSRFWLAELVFRLPDGSLLEGRGVQPDRIVEVDWWRYAFEDDPQIQAAVEELRLAGRSQYADDP